MLMDGRAVWNFAIEGLLKAVLGALEQVGKSLDEVDLVISSGQYQYHQNRNGKTAADGKTFFAQVRNAAGASVPITMREAMDEGLIDQDIVIFAIWWWFNTGC